MKESSDRDKLRKIFLKRGFAHYLWHLLGWVALIPAVSSSTTDIVSALHHAVHTARVGLQWVLSWNV